MTSITFPEGGYRFVPGVMQYSAGVRALEGFAIERVTLRRPVPLAAGFDLIERVLQGLGRPMQAFCACELRSPAPFTEAGFLAFNRLYVERLTAWQVLRDGVNPVARSNVCPDLSPPPEPSFYAFAYTVPAADPAPCFVIAGSGEVPEGKGDYRSHIVRPGDLSLDGLRDKVRFVMGEMERRLGALDLTWDETTAVQAYTVHDIHPVLADEIVGRITGPHGLTWQYCRPPVVGLDYEMDCRGIATETVLTP
ncbi:MAG: hypothetical protein U1E45_19960 [Geminicoccaceae bacterium]